MQCTIPNDWKVCNGANQDNNRCTDMSKKAKAGLHVSHNLALTFFDMAKEVEGDQVSCIMLCPKYLNKMDG